MNNIYKFTLIIIFVILVFLESLELKKNYYVQNSVSLNSNVLLQENFIPNNKNYVLGELTDLNKIITVSMKLKNKETDFKTEDLESQIEKLEGLKIKTKSGKSSIFVEALKSYTVSARAGKNNLGINSQDPITGKFIRLTSILEAHVSCGNEISELPRKIDKEDKKIKFGSDFYKMFTKKYKTVFGYDLFLEEGVSKYDNRNRIKRAEKRLFKNYESEAKSYLKTRLFENPCAVKVSDCRYREISHYVIIYYDVLTDVFAVVDSNSNQLLDFNVATKVDYVDIFRYRSVFQNITSSQLIQCQNPEKSPFGLTCPVEEGPLAENLPIIGEDESENINNDKFDNVRNRGLPEKYDRVKGWWVDRQAELISLFNPEKFDQLSTELKKDGPVRNDITIIEALTVLQAQTQNMVSGISRPDNEIEQMLNFDFKILFCNPQIFKGCKPAYVDIKSPLDPEVIRDRGEPSQSLEDQVDNILKSISSQRQRAIQNDESVIHIITLLRIKPSERAYFMQNFKTKAKNQNLDLNGVAFINTSSYTI